MNVSFGLGLSGYSKPTVPQQNLYNPTVNYPSNISHTDYAQNGKVVEVRSSGNIRYAVTLVPQELNSMRKDSSRDHMLCYALPIGDSAEAIDWDKLVHLHNMAQPTHVLGVYTVGEQQLDLRPGSNRLGRQLETSVSA